MTPFRTLRVAVTLLLVTLTVARANEPPDAVDDIYQVTAGRTLAIDPPGVLANDTDPNGDPLTIFVVQEPLPGSEFQWLPDGSFEYKPPDGFIGVDSFVYRATDGAAESLSAAVTLDVVDSGPVQVFLDEALYLAGLAARGLVPVQQNFEDEAIWGAVRTTIAGGAQTAPLIDNLGVTWESLYAETDVTTSEGAARTGLWGFYASPHGNFDAGPQCDVPRACGDGFRGTGHDLMFGVGAWLDTNTPFAKVELSVDGVVIDDLIIGTQPAFLGVLVEQGFHTFDFLEVEGVRSDAKLIFTDDVTVAMSVPPPGPFVALTGACPGPAGLLLSGFTPGGAVALAGSRFVGATLIPTGPCAGRSLGLAAPWLLATPTASPAGTVSLDRVLPPAACGWFLQAVDLGTCEIASPMRVP
jgi:hypothetical protein